MSIESVRFIVYSNDHTPIHVHGVLGGTVVIVDVFANGDVRIAERTKAIWPKNAKKSDVRKILQLAAEHSDELRSLWEKVHG